MNKEVCDNKSNLQEMTLNNKATWSDILISMAIEGIILSLIILFVWVFVKLDIINVIA